MPLLLTSAGIEFQTDAGCHAHVRVGLSGDRGPRPENRKRCNPRDTVPRTSNTISIGIDVGGTRTRVAAINRFGRVLARRQRQTPDFSAPGQLIDWLAGAVATVGDEAGIDSGDKVTMGVALPGTLDRDRNTVIRSLRLPFLQGYPVLDKLTLSSAHRAALFTDAEAATWGEYVSLSRHTKRFAHLRIGSGVACGLVIDGQLQRLDAGRKEHLDVLVVDHSSEAPTCSCGRQGCLEAVASGTALNERAGRLGYANGISGLQQAWQRGDETAQRLVRQTADAVLTAVTNIARRYDTSVITLGGGAMTRLPCLMDQTILQLHSQESSLSVVSLEPARLGDNAGVVGAALLAVDGVAGGEGAFA